MEKRVGIVGIACTLRSESANNYYYFLFIIE